ncbi:choline transporter-like protein 2 isoform X1 [Hyalella azteca]|uniref:Choline transporter-like protein n=3 Tax=Hyalella azteca TaxID=294128 RepID=A0A979FKC5_HYAAZ|nr:choline transporter-like protein 2 isoform X1 [Hyalella azteca]
MEAYKMGDKVEDEVNKYGTAHEFDPDFKGPVKSRSCTDILCLLLFVMFLVGWGVVAAFGIIHGDPSRLVYPTDSRGQVCGRDPVVEKKPYLFFFDLTRCATLKASTGCPTPQICVDKCPDKNWFYSPTTDDAEVRRNLKCQYDVDPFNTSIKTSDLVLNGKCAFYYVRSREVGRRCIPERVTEHTVDIINSIDAAYANQSSTQKFDMIMRSMKYVMRFAYWQEVAEGAFEDIKATWHLIIGFCVLAMAVSLVWIFLLRFISKVLIWFSMVAFVAICAFACYYSMSQYIYLRSRSANSTEAAKESSPQALSIEQELRSEFQKYSERESTWLVLFFVCLSLLVICLLLLIILRKRINIAVALIGQASKAVGDMMSTLLLPVLPYLLQVVTISVFCVVAVFLASAGRPQYAVSCSGACCPGLQEGAMCEPVHFNETNACAGATCQFLKVYVNPHIPRLQIYNVFALFWCLFFISAMGEMVLAGAFSSWYWAFDKNKDLPLLPVTYSLGRTLRYHIGTLAFGSLIIAIVRMIRLIFEYIDKKVREKTDSWLVKCLMCCCRCCLYCLEKFLKFVNRNAYVYCAIYGKNFCASARSSFSLLMRNIARVVVLDKVTDFLLFIGKMVVTGGVGIVAYFVFSGGIQGIRSEIPHTNYYLTPVILITIVTYFISSAFFSVYEIGVDTLFLCFLEDSERNDGSEQKPYFMSKDLMKILHKENKTKEE